MSIFSNKLFTVLNILPSCATKIEKFNLKMSEKEQNIMREGGKSETQRQPQPKSKSRFRRPNNQQKCGSCPDRHSNVKSSVHAQDSDSTEVESSTDEEERWKDVARTSEIPADYYNIQKLVKYIKAGNQTATIVSLCCLQDYDLTTQINQFAIQDIGGLEVLVNILECNDAKCRLGALTVLADISLNIDIRKTIVDLDGIPLIIDILNSSMKDLKTVAAETLANVAKVRLARKYVRNCGGIPKLVDLLDIKLQ